MTDNELSAAVFGDFMERHDEAMRVVAREDLERLCLFTWGSAAPEEVNVYPFFDRLRIYQSFCRRWEEMHNGSACVGILSNAALRAQPGEDVSE